MCSAGGVCACAQVPDSKMVGPFSILTLGVHNHRFSAELDYFSRDYFGILRVLYVFVYILRGFMSSPALCPWFKLPVNMMSMLVAAPTCIYQPVPPQNRSLYGVYPLGGGLRLRETPLILEGF